MPAPDTHEARRIPSTQTMIQSTALTLNAADLLTVLRTLRDDVPEIDLTTTYITAEEGGTFQFAMLMEECLTDGSVVHNLVLR